MYLQSLGMAMKCRIKDLMAVQRLTQQQVAGRTGLSPTIVGRLYHNKFSRLDNRTAEAVCRFFKVDLGEMFYLQEGDRHE